MSKLHYKERLSEFVDQQLPADLRQAVGEHLMQCDECRREHDAIRLGAGLAAKLGRSDAPANLWMGIENELDGDHAHVTMIPDRRPFNLRLAAGFAMAVVIVGLFTGLLYRGLFMDDAPTVVTNKGETPVAPVEPPVSTEIAPPPLIDNSNVATANVPSTTTTPSNSIEGNTTAPVTNETSDYWQVDTLAGNPQIGSGTEPGKLAVGSYLVTDGASRARVEVADIGTVDVAPNSRVKLVGTNKKQHRLSLERGSLHARIAAPPRLFIVDTPSAMAVDLGCEYTLEVDKAGNNKLHVTSGFVALERGGRESIVPAGAMCLTRKGKGLGTPFSAETTEAFRAALERFDFSGGGSVAVDAILASRNSYDIISLWHLLSRVSPADRGKVYDALVPYVAPPEGVTRDGILKLDEKMLETWREEVERVWFEG
ncbi:MAG: FecR domain-containing protein [Pyrinomonadaceae bacterium]